jgi:membrane protease YdiL (CAAX protease family)
MQGFANLARDKWFPLLMTSVIFGGMHIFNPEVSKIGYIILVYYIGTGLWGLLP